MYTPTQATPAAAPRQASYMRAALYHYAPAPYMAKRRYGQGRSMAAMLAPYSAKVRQAYLAKQWARIAAGGTPNWPRKA